MRGFSRQRCWFGARLSGAHQCAILPKLALQIGVLLSALPLGQAAEVIGATDAVARQVVGQIAQTRRKLIVQDPVHFNEIVQTNAGASARFLFKDRSDLRLGANARIRLGSFIYGGTRGTSLELTRGALRFLSGSGPTGSYQIRTPVATIGLRGTGVGVVITARRTYVTLLNGAVEVCARGGACRMLASACNFIVVDARTVSAPAPLAGGVPSFASACRGAICGADPCGNQAAGQSTLGHDPAGAASGGVSGGGPGGGGGKR